MKKVFSNWWVLTVTAAVLVALVLALALPIFVAFLRPWWARLLLIFLVLLVWGGFALWRVARGRRASDAIAEEIAKPEPTAGPGDAEAQVLGDRLRQALGQFKKASGEKRDYLYSRPWYVIIGPPGAGKTTALLNSGLRFPFSDTALKGVGGTRNLDFWFSEEAVLVDTAGRYTTQDSDAPSDARAWQSFLDLLRKHRPLQPINGVLVAIGLDELLRADRAALDAHAGAVRRRLAELQKTLEVSAPVYVLFTKADLLAGFVEYFEDLDVEGRRAVLGSTLPYPAANSADSLAAAFDRFSQAITDREPKRLQEDMDARRRGLILGFPSQLSGVRARVLRFLEGAFPAEGAAGPPLRGFYLTSGVQQGAPLDRLLGGMAQVFDAPRAAPAEGRGRAYFLNRLLGEVVFPEAGLVQSDPKARARRASALVGGLVAVGLVTVLIGLLWIVSFSNNRGLQKRLLAGAQGAQQGVHSTSLDLVEVRESDPDLEQSLSVLRSLRDLPRGYAERRKGGGPILMHLGLYQDALSRQAEESYLQALQRIMLPRILLRIERFLQDHQREPLAIYEPLKTYLMLGGQGPLDAKAAKRWIESDWEEAVLPGADRAGVRKELSAHLDALLEDRELGRVWPARAAPLDGALIASARAAVQTLSLADRAYAVLKQKGLSSGSPAWKADTVLASGDAQAFANGPQIMTLAVPGFFTRQGFERDYQVGLQTVQNDLEKDLWVLGGDVDKASIRGQLGGIRPGVAALYAKDYIAAWDKVAKAPQPAAYFSNPAAFGAFTRQPSPLKLLLLEVRKNTALSTQGAAGAAMAGVQKKLSTLPGASLVAAQAEAKGGIDAGQQIASYFKPVNDYVGDGKAPAPLDDFIAAVKTTGSANAAASVAGAGAGGASAQGQLATALGSVAAAGAGAPPALQAFVAQATQGGKTAVATAQQGAIADEYGRNLAAACHSVVENRYPFYGASQNDATIADMLRVFGMNGQFDSFARDRLAPLLETSAPIWRWKADQPVAAALDPTSAAQLQKAAELKDVLTSGVPIKVESQGFGGTVTSAEFSSGGVTYRFEANTVGAKPVSWSTQAGAPEAHVVLYAGTQELKRYAFEGPWALFRLFDAAKKENAGPTAIKATFGEGATFATFKVSLPSDKNPFSRGGLWSFRCPAKL